MRHNKALLVLFVFNSIFVFAGSFLGPLYAIYVEGITHSIIAVSLSWSVYMLSATIVTLFVAKFGDRIKEKEYLLIVGYLIRGIGWFSFIFATTLPHILLIQVLLGIGEAFGTPSFEVLFAEHIDRGKHIKEYASWRIVSNLFVAFGTLIGGWVVSSYGFQVIFVGMGVMALVSCIGILVKPRNLL